LKAAEPARYARLLGAQAEASEAAVQALLAGDAGGLLASLSAQGAALAALGDAAGAAIVTPALRSLRALSADAGAAVLPAGAGGGDVSWWVSRGAPPENQAAWRPLELGLGAEGLSAFAPPSD
jgi:mevalonate kinase